ncbi:hypothetical protein BDZ94DRAFT_768811 [Collybia nuda]|uniref:DUF6534 domain-containing protein n=1 Tax=Collybia nuda TaxID=64659 RepID=A0A9P5Y1Z1_9AGAR|nr:hypothetical protein BDZ94DRAFT_768811 [Collybia nuda]
MSSDETSQIRTLFGPVFIGLIISSVFSGASVIQIIAYTRNGKNDSFGQKLAVWFIWSLDILHLSFMVHMIYHYLVSFPTDGKLVWSFPAHVLIQVIILPAAQWLYIARIWKITPRGYKYVPSILSLLVVINLAGIFTVVKLFQSSTIQARNDIPGKKAVTIFFSMTTSLDILIAGTLCCALAKAGTNLRWTNSNVTMLLAYLVNTGAIVSLFSISALIIAVKSPGSGLFLAIGAISTRMYVNSLLGMVNARHYFQPRKAPMALVLRSETSSQHNSMDETTQRVSKTINEVGLPLFQRTTTPEQEIRMLEVMVKKEAHACAIE